MTYHHTPGHPVADIYAEYLRVSEFRQAFMDLGKRRDLDESAHVTEHPVQAEEEYQHTPVPPHVWDIYAEYLTTVQAMIDAAEEWIRIRPRKRYTSFSPWEPATEHPVEVSEGWLGCSDFESDDPGGWSK